MTSPSDHAPRTPTAATEARLLELREEALREGKVEPPGITPAGAPFPIASPATGYYQVPLLKEPQWKWEVPVYFFVGGAAGAASVVAEIARLTQRDSSNSDLVRHARWIAAAGSVLSPALLVADLGRPARFLNMLRVFKLQSPMSVGSWTLVTFSTAAAATLFAYLMRERFGPSLPITLLEESSGALAAATGLVMASYTGVLIGATAIPVWSDNVKSLPLHFAASGMNSAVSLLELMGHTDSRALNAIGVASSLAETIEGLKLEMDSRPVLDPLKHGPSGWITRAGGALSGPVPLLLRIASAASSSGTARTLRRAAAVASLAGSLLTRIGWVRAGHASARDFRLPLGIAPPSPPSLDDRIHHLEDSLTELAEFTAAQTSRRT